MKARIVLFVILATGILISATAMWKNYSLRGGVLNFDGAPQQSAITATEKSTVQLPTSSTEVFIAQSTGFDHLEAFDCAANSRESYRGMIERMNLWLKSNPQFQGMGFSAVPDNRGNYLKFVLVCKRTGVVNLEKVKKKKD